MRSAVERANAVRRENAEETKRKRRRRRPSLTSLRISELSRLFRARFGDQLPNDEDGLKHLAVMAHHLVTLPGNAQMRIHEWAKMHAPWCPIADLDDITDDALRRPRRWKADRLAWHLKLTEQDRKALRITTIGAIDCGKGSRTAKRRNRNRAIKQATRRASGMRPRQEYESNSLSRSKPWKALGISRATYYRSLKRSAPLSE